MQQPPLAYLNGDYIPFDQLKLPVYDLGIVQGATITERLRTFAHQPHLLDEHLQRLRESATAIGLPSALVDPLDEVVEQLIEKNSQHPDSPEHSVVIFITAGDLVSDANGLIDQSIPTVCVYTTPLSVKKYQAGYQQGIPLLTSSVRQLSASTVSPQIKMRSRLHWYLADLEVKQRNPHAMALLLDENGCLTETSSGNLFLVKNEKLFTPPASATLNGIAQGYVISLAEDLGLEVARVPLTLDDLAHCSEYFLTSSTYCIMPVTSINDHKLAATVPGTMALKLSEVWSESVGVNFREPS